MLFEQAKQLPQVYGPYPYGDVLALGVFVLGGIVWFGDEALKLAQKGITALASAITAAGAPNPSIVNPYIP